MDLSKLAQALGVAKDAPQDKVFAAAAKAVLEGTKAQESLSKLQGELGKYGLSLDQGNLVKVEAPADTEALAINSTDDAQAAAWKKELLERRQKDRLASVSTIGSALDRVIKEGRVPPAAKEVLSRVAGAITGKTNVLALSKDGAQVISTVSESLNQEFLKALESFPRMTLSAEGLSVLKTEPLISDPVAGKDSEALAQKGREAAARASRSSKTFKEKLSKK